MKEVAQQPTEEAIRKRYGLVTFSAHLRNMYIWLHC